MESHSHQNTTTTVSLFGLLALLLIGCSSTYNVRSDNLIEMNKELEGEDATIELQNGQEVSAKQVRLEGDSVSWIDQKTTLGTRVRHTDVRRVVTRNHMLGAFEGFGLGLLIGGSVGAAIGSFTTKTGSEIIPGWFAWGFIGGASGGVIGLFAGVGGGHAYNYEFATLHPDSLKGVIIEKAPLHYDAVFLKDGTEIRGRITEELRTGDEIVRVTIKGRDGVSRTFTGSEILRIEKSRPK